MAVALSGQPDNFVGSLKRFPSADVDIDASTMRRSTKSATFLFLIDGSSYLIVRFFECAIAARRTGLVFARFS